MASWNPEANELFLKALELGCPEYRREYLDEACARQPELRAQVEALLRASACAGGFLDRPAIAPANHGEQPSGNHDRVSDEPAGTALPELLGEGPSPRVGPYKLVQPIGEGGMGVVYLAEQQEPVRRQVALKIIKPGLDSTRVIARFEAERQALALMDHPNIAKVLDAGTTQCSPLAEREGYIGEVAQPLAQREGYTGRPFFVMELVKGMPLTR
jgi:hypothetical protein